MTYLWKLCVKSVIVFSWTSNLWLNSFCDICTQPPATNTYLCLDAQVIEDNMCSISNAHMVEQSICYTDWSL